MVWGAENVSVSMSSCIASLRRGISMGGAAGWTWSEEGAREILVCPGAAAIIPLWSSASSLLRSSMMLFASILESANISCSASLAGLDSWAWTGDIWVKYVKKQYGTSGLSH